MIIAFANQKGGVGKTTSVVNVGAGLQKLGKKVLLIDMDPQSHLTYSLGVQPQNKTIYELLKGDISINETIIDRNGLKIIPSTIDVSGAEFELAGIPGREFLLKVAFRKLTDRFDYILIDCPPSLGLLTVNAFTTTQEVYIPLQTENLAMQGMSKLLQTIEIVKERLNGELKVTGVIATRFDSRRNLNKQVVEIIKKHFGDKLFETLIRENVSLAETPSFGKTIFEYKPESSGAEDYTNLCKEILKRNEI
jgi:chromosome partitioning protein